MNSWYDFVRRHLSRHAWATLGLAGLLAAIGGGGLVLITSGCGSQATSATPADDRSAEQSTAVQTVSVQRKDLSQTIEMPGTVDGYETVELYAKVGGYLQQLSVDIGDAIKQGEVLARLHVPEMEKQLEQKQALVEQAESGVEQAKAAIRQSEADIASAEAAIVEVQTQMAEKQAALRFRQAEFDRYEELVSKRAIQKELLDQAKYQLEVSEAALHTIQAQINTATAALHAAQTRRDKSEADLGSAEAQLKVARADVNYIRTMLEYAEIKAPFDGHVTRRFVDPGAFIQPAEGNSAAKPLLQVTRTDLVRIFLDIPMGELRFLDLGDRVELDRISVLPGETFPGEVSRFSAAINEDSRMMRVEIDLENPQGRLRPGYFGYVTVFLEELPAVPVIPSSALMTEGEQTFVYVVRDGTIHRRPVVSNYQDGIVVGIGSGLEGGELVVQSGGGQLHEGQRVTTSLGGMTKRG